MGDLQDGERISIPASSPLYTPLAEFASPRTTRPLPTQPGLVQAQFVTTPPIVDISEPSLNMICGGALAPISTKTQDELPVKTRPGLQLPSFDALGIAAPHPDRYGFAGSDNAFANHTTSSSTPESLDGLALSPQSMLEALKLDAPTHSAAPKSFAEGLPARGILSPAQQHGNPLTPPEDLPCIHWSNATFTTQSVAGADDIPTSLPPPTESVQTGDSNISAGEAGNIWNDGEGPRLWYQSAIEALADNIRSAPQRKDSLRVLSHALPSPSPEGHVFSDIIAAIQNTSAVESWINVFHAIPGRFNLADLPRSPPTTPGPAVGGSDYFTEKIFDSAVPIADYQEDLTHLPRSPRAVVPPGSIDVSIVERYIPPTSSIEFDTMFELNGQSILVDRLKEISPNNGSLLLVYPTMTGGKTFMREYLSPVLDPTLRSMGVVHGLSASMAGTLGGMLSVKRLSAHEVYESRVRALLDRIAQGGPTVDRIFEQRNPAAFTLTYAAKKRVVLDRTTWAQDWWTKQEKVRVREAVARYAREAQMRSSNAHVDRPKSATELLHELLKGVVEKPYPPGQEPANGIEVSVFVIERTA